MAYMTAEHTGNIPAAEGGAKAREILEKHIAAGQKSALNLMEYLETKSPHDSIVTGQGLVFERARPAAAAPRDLGQALTAIDATLDATEQARQHKGVVVRVGKAGQELGIGQHALVQMAERAGVPAKYLRESIEAGGWRAELAAEILRRHYNQGEPGAKFLVRAVEDQVRGFLSSKYRRLDSRPLVEAFAAECQKINAVPVHGEVSETRIALKAIIPIVYEPLPGECVTFGVEWSNSDFGHGKHSARAFILRVWCLNGATMENALAQIHLGRDLSGDVEISDRTRRLDTAASVSALQDVIGGLLAPGKVEQLCNSIRGAEAKEIDWRHLSSKLARKLMASELAETRAAFEGQDVYNLPRGNTTWRASNALSWIAGKTEDPNRRLDLERLAGQLLHGRADADLAEAA